MCQLVIDMAGELSARRGERFEDYTEAVGSLGRDARFPVEVVRALERLPGFRNVVVDEYITLDMDRVIDALDELAPVEHFLHIVRDLVRDAETP